MAEGEDEQETLVGSLEGDANTGEQGSGGTGMGEGNGEVEEEGEEGTVKSQTKFVGEEVEEEPTKKLTAKGNTDS